jgi:hypothetical protein
MIKTALCIKLLLGCGPVPVLGRQQIRIASLFRKVVGAIRSVASAASKKRYPACLYFRISIYLVSEKNLAFINLDLSWENAQAHSPSLAVSSCC